ncbi:beta-ketoacyl-ACP synthase III [Pseudonocardia xinjiangensis]|uniref:beta-ketoacyl-ACP synthase III n=1 Tax=Pseudonocardia xinjiangensis TaxID=75289 RepID=UPI003D922945
MTGTPETAAPGVVVAGIGHALPPRVVTNAELAQHLDTSDEWIRTRTGIRQRHVVDPGTATSDLAVEAGARALASAGMQAVDLLVLATTTPDHPCPASAPAVSSRLGLGAVPAFDLNAVCSGFVYGLAVTTGMLRSGAAGSALLIGVDTFSTIVDPADRATAFLFGDGAGAVVLRAEPGGCGILDVELGSDGGLQQLIQVRSGGSRQPISADPADGFFAMQGQAVYRHAVAHMTASTATVLSRVGWSVQDVDWFVGHQANRRILEATAARLGIPAERTLVNLDRVGNTAAASIPIALAEAAAAGDLRAGHKLAVAAFGGGATWGSAALVWPELPSSG